MKYELRFKISALHILLFLNTIIFILALLVDNTVGFDRDLFFLFGGEVIAEVLRGNFWLLVTASFFHINLLHFLLNMYSLFKMGKVIEHFYGGKKLFTTYIFGAIGASLFSTIMAVVLRAPVLSLGASGSIFALVGLLFGGSMKKYRYGNSLPFRPLDILPVIVLPFLVGFLPGLNINNWAHAGGLIAGFLLGLVFNHSMSGHYSKFNENLEKILHWTSIVLFIGAYVMLFVNAFNLIYS